MPRGIYERTPEMNVAMPKATKDIPKSPETCAKMSEWQKDIPKTPEHIAAIKKGQEESGMYDAMRGGNDICDHHVSYDFGRPEALIVKVTRSFHGQIHHPKGCKFGTYGYSLID